MIESSERFASPITQRQHKKQINRRTDKRI